MFFSNTTRSNSSYIANQQIKEYPATMGFSKRFNTFKSKQMALLNAQQQELQQKESQTVGSVIPEKKMKWGEPTWFLFHTLAEKVKPEAFEKIRRTLFDIIINICANLPCPDCATHATAYLKNINFETIKTKEDLKQMLFVFHNFVNKRKNIPIFSMEELTEKYSVANTNNIIQHFMIYFQDKHYSVRMIANDFHRTRLVQNLKTWFNNNIQYFEP